MPASIFSSSSSRRITLHSRSSQCRPVDCKGSRAVNVRADLFTVLRVVTTIATLHSHLQMKMYMLTLVNPARNIHRQIAKKAFHRVSRMDFKSE